MINIKVTYNDKDTEEFKADDYCVDKSGFLNVELEEEVILIPIMAIKKISIK